MSQRREIGEFLWRRMVVPIRRRLSSVKVGGSWVRVRNFPGRSRSYSVDAVKQFEWRTDAIGHFAVLRVADGSDIDVLALDHRHPARLDNLNVLLDLVRQSDAPT